MSIWDIPKRYNCKGDDNVPSSNIFWQAEGIMQLHKCHIMHSFTKQNQLRR